MKRAEIIPSIRDNTLAHDNITYNERNTQNKKFYNLRYSRRRIRGATSYW